MLDALDDAHLDRIGAALLQLDRPVFAMGAGGLSRALGRSLAQSSEPVPSTAGLPGPVLAVSGSRSAQTRRQADAAAAAGWLVRPLPLGGKDDCTGEVIRALSDDRSVVLTSDDAAAPESGFGATAEDALRAIARAAASVVSAVVHAGVSSRVIVCGGDTSGRVVRALGVESVVIADNPVSNVVLLRAQAADPAVDGVELVLKGGQVGDDDLFESVRLLGGPKL